MISQAEVDSLRWRSACDNSSGNCVEVADLGDGARGIRDSKNPGGPVLQFDADEWAAFTAGIKTGEFDR